jgi:deazaflavin-dependent oxidoreductase (nitroreductase family)
VASDRFFKNMNRMHRVVRAFTFGKVGWTAANMPVLELTTIGRTSGEPRTVLLTAPVAMGESLVIVASKGGHPTHPAWYLNLLENPNVTVTTEVGTRRMRARVVDDTERVQLWTEVTAAARNYATYQEKTDRQIPIVVLEPT